MVCIENLRASGLEVDFCVDNDGDVDHCNGVKIIHGDEHLAGLRLRGYSRIFVAIGDNSVRTRLSESIISMGFEMVNAIHPSAIVSPSATLGYGIAIMAGAIINAEAVIGSLSIINTGSVIEHGCTIGCSVHVAPLSALAGNVSVGDMSNLGIGSRAIPGVSIGRRVTLGAGSVVIDDIADGLTCVGMPARPLLR